MQFIILPTGEIRCTYAEVIDLMQLGQLSVQRASHVEPDTTGRWFADLSLVAGPVLGPFDRRSDALAAEHAWLEVHRLRGG